MKSNAKHVGSTRHSEVGSAYKDGGRNSNMNSRVGSIFDGVRNSGMAVHTTIDKANNGSIHIKRNDAGKTLESPMSGAFCKANVDL